MSKILDQANDLEQLLWMAAESIGFPRSQKTFDRFMEELKVPSMHFIENQAPIDHKKVFALGFYVISLVRDYGEEGEEMWPVICACHLAVGVIMGGHSSSNNLAEEALSNALRSTFSKLGKEGAIKRHAPNRKLKQWTLEQYWAGDWAKKISPPIKRRATLLTRC